MPWVGDIFQNAAILDFLDCFWSMYIIIIIIPETFVVKEILLRLNRTFLTPLAVFSTVADFNICWIARFQRLFLHPSWLTSSRTSGHQKLVPKFSWVDNCLMVTKQDFLEMEASQWLNKKSQNRSSIAKGWSYTLCCWEAAVRILDSFWKNVDVEMMMMMKFVGNCNQICFDSSWGIE